MQSMVRDDTRAMAEIAALKQELESTRSEYARLRVRFDLIRQATSDGLWDMETNGADPTNPANPFWWSDQFRRLLGFSTEQEFPNVLGSWSSRLHPDDFGPTMTAFAAHIHDRTGRTPYDVTYRLRCRDGEYRWFRALGHTMRDADGKALRVAGALTDITDRNALLSMKRYAEDIVASLPAGLIVLDESLRIQSVNRSSSQVFGLESECDDADRELAVILQHPGLREHMQATLDSGESRHGIAVSFGSRHARVAMARTVLADGKRQLLLVAEDVTEEHRLRDEARRHTTRHRDQASLLDKARDAIIVRGIDRRIEFWNQGAERLYGWRAEEVIGRSVDGLLYPDTTRLTDAIGKTLAHGEWTGEFAQLRKNGEGLTVEGHWTLVRGDDGQPKSILVINTDITQRKAAEESIRKLAFYDTLTGLPNRTQFIERLKRALAHAQQNRSALAIMFMDLNRFKEINDTQGHGVGDEVLVDVARRFCGVLQVRHFLARLAGDEFVVIVEAADATVAGSIAERLEQALAEPIAASGHTFSIGVSIGIACYPDDGKTMRDLLRCADIAMYRAKALGKRHLFYRPEMSVGLAEQMEIAKDLRRAMTAGLLELHYQPQVNLSTGELIGAEALLRWNDPGRGWVSPAKFIPIAEARGMIGALGEWVLREACRQMAIWKWEGLHFPGRLSINLAAQQLDEVDIAACFHEMVCACGLSPSVFDLELTESGLMGNVERAISIMMSLKSVGFSLSIDDFGTGYSSLAYLKRLPADKLKIDMSFVRDMLRDRHDHTIVTTIIGMARNLGLRVIAEGVEEPAQAHALLSLGCDEAQGYYYGRPEPADVFACLWLKEKTEKTEKVQ